MPPKEKQPESIQQIHRLCSEIQLFDLCDLERCSFMDGRFCTKSELLVRFEHISDVDECAKVQNYFDEPNDNGDDADDAYFHGEDDGEDLGKE